MKATLTLTLLTALASLSDAIRLVKKDAPAVISAKTQRKPIKNGFDHDRRRIGAQAKLRRRQDDTVSVTLENDITLYYINVTIGTPAEEFALHIDTGSSDLWVNTPDSAFCQRYSQYCTEAGVYDSDDSSTYELVDADGFNVTYADGSAATGDYVTDTLGIGDATLSDFQLGVASTSNSPEGILGVGYVINEGASQTGADNYANLPKALQSAGVINTNAYSLYLDDLDSNSGTILFGGVDTSKFSGDLTTFPIISTYGYYSEFLIGLTGVGVNGNAGSIVSDQAVAVLLDSGTSLTYLPDSVTSALYSRYGTSYSSRIGAAQVDCSLGNQDGSVDFTFSSLTISVPLSELVINISETQGQELCAFGIAPAGTSGIAVMGDTFLRSAYVVYDLTNNEISMAQASYDTGSTDIQEISTGSDGVPSATAVASPVTAVGSVVTGVIGSIETVAVGNAALPMITPPPSWKVGTGLAAGAAALAFL